MTSDSDPPVVDGRTPAELLDWIEEAAPAYTDEWDPTSRDVGWTVAERFSEMAGIVVDRIDRVPSKHRVAFYDALGFDRAPPQAARLPLTATLVEDLTENVAVPPGTRATAPGADGEPEQTFEVVPGEAFEATPARLQRLYSVDPATDGVFAHAAPLNAGDETRLFDGENVQSHALSIGHADRLNLSGGATVWVAWTPSVSVSDLGSLLWEYYEEREDDEPGDHWHAFDRVQHRSLVGGVVTILDVPADSEETEREFTETDVGGVTARWLRCRIDPVAAATGRARLLALTVDDLALLVGGREDSGSDASSSEHNAGTDSRPDALAPDLLLANGVPVPTPSTADVVSPFGPTPITGETFAIAAEEAFSKRGSKVELIVDVENGTTATEPEVRWQYWNGSAWALLDVEGTTRSDVSDVSDMNAATDAESVLRLRRSGRVRFTVPNDLEPTAVSGHEGHWIRARVMESEFGPVEYSGEGIGTENQTWEVTMDNPAASELIRLSVAYGATPLSKLLAEATKTNIDAVLSGAGADVTPPTHLVATNALADAVHDGPIGAGFRPFAPLPDADQALYVGVDAPLRDGPIHLFVSPTDRSFPDEFLPDVQWEYWDDTGWRPADVRDGTEGLTERGIVRLTFPTPTTSRSLFGWSGHWLRARVSGTRFDPMADMDTATGSSLPGTGVGFRDDSCPPPCTAKTLETDPPAGTPTTAPPTLVRVALNTGWAVNVHTVTEEALGTGDGTPDRTVDVSSTPVVTATVWVDELATLSDGDRRRLATEQPDDIRAVPAGGRDTGLIASETADLPVEDDLATFWVRWEEVPDFLASTATDRHYTLDRLAGRVTFGDGVAGAVPPRGAAIVATYETGGGSAGNVAAGAVSELKNDIVLVDSVTNPEAADGGADVEMIDAVVARAPRELRDRNRAVAPADYERLALAASHRLARARCLPRMDEAGESRLGWVTVLIVPNSDDVRPAPSAELREQVETELSAHAPITLLSPDSCLVVRGPSYVTVSVETRLASVVGERVSALEARAVGVITAFLHPLTGADGGGWRFGHLPCVSDLIAVLEGVDGVDHVENVTLTYAGSGTPVTVGEGEEPPDVGPDTLVHSGTHTVGIRPVIHGEVGATTSTGSSDTELGGA